MLYMILTWAAVIFTSIWLFYRRKFSYFERLSINHNKAMPIIGNFMEAITQTDHFVYNVQRFYNQFPEDRFVGYYEFIQPIIWVRDIELIKKITVKDFDHFTDHRNFTSEGDPFFPKSLFGMKGEKWRNMRSTLSPAFTASKLRSMIPFMLECSDDLMDYLLTEAKKSDGELIIDGRDVFSRFTNDVIASCAFGLKINSINDKNNEFHSMGDRFTTFDAGETIKFLLISAVPFLRKFVNQSFISPQAVKYFSKIFLDTMKNREENNIQRADMLQLIMAAKKGTLTHEKSSANEKDAGFATAEESDVGKHTKKYDWDDQHIVAQALIFLFAGFDTVSTAMTFMMVELAMNPDVQEKLRQEIDDSYEKNGGKIDYDKLNELKYMDMCFSETLRKWPPLASTDRVCVKPYNMGIPYPSGPEYIAPVGQIMSIPTHAIHMDEKHHPDPEKFDPERFSDENKHKIKPFTYLPFGLGPRNCIGSRFAISEVKLLVFSVLRQFEVQLGPKTKLPLHLDKKSFNFKLEGGHWFRLKLRNTES